MFSALCLLASLLAQAVTMNAPRPTQPVQAEPSYRIYDATGKAASMEDLLAAFEKVEVVCIGEVHDDGGAHAFEADLLRRAQERSGQSVAQKKQHRRLALSLEMFERDVQVALDEYLRGQIIERHFIASSRPWNNYQQDYRPLVEFAREQKLPVIAANAPGRYVNRVARLGPDSLKELTPAARAWLPPLPYKAASPAYAAKFKQLMAEPQGASSQPSPHGASFLLEAQALRDATMAFALTEHLKHHKDALILHLNGNFHSEERLGVPEQIRHFRPQTRTLVITIVKDSGYPNFDAARLGKLGDFIVLTDPSRPRSF